MIDMKMKPVSTPTMLSDIADDAYPEGMKFEVSGEQLQALGIGSGNLPQVGQKMMINAQVEVVEVCKEDGQVEPEYCVEFQIQAMQIVTEQDAQNEQQRAYSQVERMFG